MGIPAPSPFLPQTQETCSQPTLELGADVGQFLVDSLNLCLLALTWEEEGRAGEEGPREWSCLPSLSGARTLPGGRADPLYAGVPVWGLKSGLGLHLYMGASGNREPALRSPYHPGEKPGTHSGAIPDPLPSSSSCCHPVHGSAPAPS